MALKIAINGFGRIGRLVFRALHEQGRIGSEFEVVAVNDLVPADNLAYLLRYDSVHGRFPGTVSSESLDCSTETDDTLVVDGHRIRCLAVRGGPSAMPWRELGASVIIESTGLFTEESEARGHLEAGAKKVIISAPGKGNLKTVVMGVNDGTLTAEDEIISNASCTTNCLAPITKVILDNYGIDEGLMTTVHSYTATQRTNDGPSPKDMKGGRAAAMNIIPSSTGAARAVGLVLPQVQGKLTGMAFRVPTANVSVVDLTVRTSTETTYEDICDRMREASEGPLKGILSYTEDEVVSSDFIHDPSSSIFDAGAGIGLNRRMFKLVSWYDNEWGYSNRCVDLLRRVAALSNDCDG